MSHQSAPAPGCVRGGAMLSPLPQRCAGEPRRHDDEGDLTADATPNMLRAGRKRAQNRISQRCTREKKRLSQRMKLDLVVAADAAAKTNGPLHRAYLDLVREKEELTTALLDTRRKLLSMSTAAAAAAEHPIFQKILGLETANDGSDIPGLDAEDNDDAVAAAPTQTPTAPPVATATSHAIDHGHDLSGVMPTHPPTLPVDTLSNVASVWPPKHHNLSSPVSHPTRDEINQTPLPLEADWGEDMLLNGSVDFGGYEDIFGATEWPMADCPSEAVEKLEETILFYIAHRFGIQDVSSLTRRTDIELAARARSIRLTLAGANILQVHHVLDEAAAACIKLMSSYSCLESYIFGVGAHVHMEHIMRWRLAPSTANRACIPAPFCPTPLQYNRDHPTVIDFINWPTIRDQLILHQGEYDLDEMVKDIVNGTVIDTPDMGYSFNVRDLFMTLVDCENTTALESDSAGHVAGDTPFIEAKLTRSRPELLSHVVATMRQQTTKKIAQVRRPWETGYADDPRTSSSRAHKLCQDYGLSDLSQWKLSSKFATKYPFLDYTGVLALYPLRSALLSPHYSQRMQAPSAT